jgi:hypothetical protein
MFGAHVDQQQLQVLQRRQERDFALMTAFATASFGWTCDVNSRCSVLFGVTRPRPSSAHAIVGALPTSAGTRTWATKAIHAM